MAQKEYRIQAGPSQLDLIFSLFVGSTAEGNRQTVKFQLGTGSDDQIKLSMKIRIEGLTREDGSGDNWLFTGYQELSTGSLEKVSGYYNSHRRTGTLKVG